MDCTIECIEDDLLGEAIKATIIIKTEKRKEEILLKIKQHCAKNLSLFKIPKVFELNEQLVISATGKKIKGKL